MSDLGLNLNIWNADVKSNAIIFTNGIKQDFHSRENHLLKSIKTRLFLYLLSFILHLIEALNSHFAPFSSAICSLFHKISNPKFQLFKPKNTSFSYFYTFQSQLLHTTREQIQPYQHAKLFTLFCILYQLRLHLAPFRLAFTTSQHGVQHELALHLLRVSNAFTMSQQCILLQIAQFCCYLPATLHKYTFFRPTLDLSTSTNKHPTF